MCMAASAADAQYGNEVLEELIARKGLEFNYDKSMFLIMGIKKARKALLKQVEKQQILLCVKKMKEVTVLKYLGDQISINLVESVHQTVLKRVSLAKHLIYEIRTVVEDTRANSLGALNVAFTIWNSGIIPMIIFSLVCLFQTV